MVHIAVFMVKTHNSDALGLKTYPKEAWKVDCDWDLQVRDAIQQRINTWNHQQVTHFLISALAFMVHFVTVSSRFELVSLSSCLMASPLRSDSIDSSPEILPTSQVSLQRTRLVDDFTPATHCKQLHQHHQLFVEVWNGFRLMFTGGFPWKIGTNNTSHHQGAPKVYSPAAQRSPYWFCFCIAFAQHHPGNPHPFGDPMRRRRKRNPAAPSSPHRRLAARHMGTKFWGFCGAKYLGIGTWLGCYLQLSAVTRGKFLKPNQSHDIKTWPNRRANVSSILCYAHPVLNYEGNC